MKKVLCVGKIKRGKVTLTVDRETLRRVAKSELNEKILVECFLGPVEYDSHVPDGNS